MKIKLSKSQWEQMGKTAGWIKKAQLATPSGAPQPATNNQIGTQRVQTQQQQQPTQATTLSGILQQYPDVGKAYENLRVSLPHFKKLLGHYQINWQSIPEILELIG